AWCHRGLARGPSWTCAARGARLAARGRGLSARGPALRRSGSGGGPGCGAGRRDRGAFGAAQLLEDRRVLERGDVLRDLLAARDRFQEPPHDLARAGLRQIVGEADVVGLGDRPELLAYPLAQLLRQSAGIAPGPLATEHDVGEHRLALDVVGLADDGGLGDARVRHQRRLDLHGAEAVSRHPQHVVDATHDPEIAVLVAVRAVAGHVVAVVELLPVVGDVAGVVAPDSAQHRRPGLPDHEIAAGVGALHAVAAVVD